MGSVTKKIVIKEKLLLRIIKNKRHKVELTQNHFVDLYMIWKCYTIHNGIRNILWLQFRHQSDQLIICATGNNIIFTKSRAN